MAIAKRSLCVVFLSLALLSAAEARHTYLFFICHEPVEGDYEVAHGFPDPEDENGFVVGATSSLKLTKAFPGVYTGSGYSNPFDPALGANVPFNLLAIFDAHSCTLTGSAYSFPAMGNEVFRWTVFKDTLVGPYISVIGDDLFFRRLGHLEATKV